MRSIIANTSPTTSIHFHVITSGIRPRERHTLARTVAEAGCDAEISFGSFDTNEVKHLIRSRLISRTAYVRIFLGKLLPPEIERSIYVDCDVAFERDVVELWETDLEGRCAGAVDNGKWQASGLHQRRLGLRESKYFNSGVLLIDLSRWRERNIDAHALTLAEEMGDRLILHDQDALNLALEDDWLALAQHWNVWVIDPELQEDSAAVFHFMGWPKPWHADYGGRFQDKFFSYLDLTPFKGWRPWNPFGLGSFLRRAGRRVPYLPAIPRILRIKRSASAPSRAEPSAASS